MELVNHTPVPASIVTTELSDGLRGGIITAKATFRFAADDTALDSQQPVGLCLGATPTELGLLPPDQPYLAGDDRFEVVVLGCAHAEQPVAQMVVAVSVGEVRNELIVTGDRTWVSRDGGLHMSQPVPFTKMPLTWERAFGGRCALEIDDGATIEVADPRNPSGRGFDADAEIRRQVAALTMPEGYPKYTYERLLPNIERRDDRIASPRDRPRPACWATRPLDSALRGEHVLEGIPDEVKTPQQAGQVRSVMRSLRSAADEWVIRTPPSGAVVALEGLTSSGCVTFALPTLQVHADYAVGDRTGSLPLRARQLVLLPEQRRFYLLFHAMFRVPYAPEEERSVRLRLAG